MPGEIISIFESQKISAHDIGGVNGIQDALKNNEVVMTTQFITGEDNHSIVIVGPRSDGAGYIAYDTDRTAGYYTLITEDQINPVYVIGVKKK